MAYCDLGEPLEHVLTPEDAMAADAPTLHDPEDYEHPELAAAKPKRQERENAVEIDPARRSKSPPTS